MDKGNLIFETKESYDMKKKVMGLFLTSILVLSMISGCSGSSSGSGSGAGSGSGSDAQAGAEEVRLIFATAVADTHPYALGMAKIAELMSEKTGGTLTGDVFNNSQLGSERDLVEGLQLSTVSMTCVSTAPLSGFTDAFLVFDLPFLFATTEIARGVLDSDIGSEILASVDDQGLIGLSWFENGFRNITNSKLPIETPADLKGIKIRTMENQMHMAAFYGMGADPTPMAFGELFTALQQGTLDAQENPVPIIETSQFDQVQKYLSMTGHAYAPVPVLGSKDVIEALSQEYQEIIRISALEAAPYQREQIDIQTEGGIALLQERGMEVNYPDSAPFQEATQVVYTDFIGEGTGKVSPAIYDRVLEVIANY